MFLLDFHRQLDVSDLALLIWCWYDPLVGEKYVKQIKK